VEAELCFDLLDRLIAPVEGGSEPVSVSCAPSRIADVVGQKRSNIQRLRRERGVRVDRVRGDCSLTPFEIRVESSCGTRSGNIVEDLRYI
jgi:hypothetical protein